MESNDKTENDDDSTDTRTSQLWQLPRLKAETPPPKPDVTPDWSIQDVMKTFAHEASTFVKVQLVDGDSNYHHHSTSIIQLCLMETTDVYTLHLKWQHIQ